MEEDQEKEFIKDAASFTALFQKYRSYVIAFVISMPINCVILEVEWLDDPIKDNEFEHTFSLFFLCFIFTMCMISYYHAITIESHPEKKSIPEKKSNFPRIPLLKHDETCTKGNCSTSWKPMRAHHCKICNICTLRMDHHCPWTVNCVGLQSHKAFYLNTTYWAVKKNMKWLINHSVSNLKLGGIQYLYRSYYFYYHGEMKTVSFWFYFYWFYTTLIVFFITCMLISLFYYHTLLAMSNLTSIDDKKGIKLCFGITDTILLAKERKFNLNFFDEGIIANFVKFLDNSYFLFWWPHKVITPHDGELYETIPFATKGELMAQNGQYKRFENKQEYKNFLKSCLDTINYEINENYKNKRLKFQNSIFP